MQHHVILMLTVLTPLAVMSVFVELAILGMEKLPAQVSVCHCLSSIDKMLIWFLGIMECSIGASSCPSNADCVYSGRSYGCICQVGYNGDGSTSCTGL